MKMDSIWFLHKACTLQRMLLSTDEKNMVFSDKRSDKILVFSDIL